VTTPHTPPAALLDVAAIEARGVQSPDDALAMADAIIADEDCDRLVEYGCDTLLVLTREVRSLRAHVASEPERTAAAVDAAARSTRGACAAQLRARAECLRRYAADAVRVVDAAEYAHDAREVDACAAIVASVALAAPTGGGE